MDETKNIGCWKVFFPYCYDSICHVISNVAYVEREITYKYLWEIVCGKIFSSQYVGSDTSFHESGNLNFIVSKEIQAVYKNML